MNRVAIVLFVGLFCGGCASTGYFADRAHDFGDIFTAELGYGVGAKVRAGPVHAGAACVFAPMGLSNGEPYWNVMTEEECPCDVEVVCKGVEYAPRGQQRGKDYTAGWGWPFIAWPVSIPAGGNRKALWPHPYYTDIRVTAGLGPAVTLGFNPGELLDFILGWTTIDIFNDDHRESKR